LSQKQAFLIVSVEAYFGLWIERLSSFYEQKTGMRLYPGTTENAQAHLPRSFEIYGRHSQQQERLRFHD